VDLPAAAPSRGLLPAGPRRIATALVAMQPARQFAEASFPPSAPRLEKMPGPGHNPKAPTQPRC